MRKNHEKKAKRKSPSQSLRTESKKAVSGPQNTPRRTAKPKPKSTDTDELIQIWDEDLCE